MTYDLIADPSREVDVYVLVVDAAGKVVADCGVLGWSTDDQEAMARRIVDALNGECRTCQEIVEATAQKLDEGGS